MAESRNALSDALPGRLLKIGVSALVGIAVGFLIAFAWQNTRATRLRHTAEYASRALQAARLEATLAAAVIAAQDGRYEIGRQYASTFFTGLQRGLAPDVAGRAGDVTRQMLTRRDPIITSLARNDPASPSVLGEALTQYRELIRQAGLDSAVVPTPSRP